MLPFTSTPRYRQCAPWVITLLACLLLASLAQANPRYAAMVVEADSGEVLYAANAEAQRYPASLTKMMTLYLLFEALETGRLSLDQPLIVSPAAAAMPASKLWLKPGQRIPVETAIEALVVRSANDVAVVVAEALAGSETRFARRMTAKARELGLQSTRFRNASGLPDPRQVTTARDMVVLSHRLMRDFPQYYPYFSRTHFTWRGKTHSGHNRLLEHYPGTDGLKTGYIRASGFNVATSSVRHGKRLLSVVMGGFTAASRDAHMTDLLDRGFLRASLQGRGDWIARTDISGERLDLPPAPSRLLADLQATPPATDPIQALIARREAESGQGSRAGSWGVQVGAFHDPEQARRIASHAVARLADELAGARVAVAASDESARRVYRARLVDLEAREAENVCRRLVRDGMDCLVVNAAL